jgi:C4-dicarboxylate transporter DctM subunit
VALFRRKLDWSSFKDVIVETGAITAGLLFLMIAASAYGRMLTMSTIPMELASMIGAMSIGLIGFVLLYTVIVVLLGMILDSVSIMLILLPIALPILAPLGGDLIWFGIITVIAIEIGLLTPPFGLSVYVVKGSLPPGFASLGDIFAASAPFVIVMAVVTLAVIFIPWLATALL